MAVVRRAAANPVKPALKRRSRRTDSSRKKLNLFWAALDANKSDFGAMRI